MSFYDVQGFYNKQKSIEGFTNSYSFPKLFEGYDIPTEAQQTSGRTGTTVATNGTTVTTTGTTVTTTGQQGQGQGPQGQQGQGQGQGQQGPQGQGAQGQSQGQGQQGQGQQGQGQGQDQGQGQGQQGQGPQGQGQQGQSQGQGQQRQGQGQQGQGQGQGQRQQGQGQQGQGQGQQRQGQGQGQGQRQQGQGQGQQGAQGQGQGQQGQGQEQQGRQGQGQGQQVPQGQGQGQVQQISSIINNILNNSLFTGYISDLVSNKFTELNNSQQNTNKIVNMKTYTLKDPEVLLINDSFNNKKNVPPREYNDPECRIFRISYQPKLAKSKILMEISSFYNIGGHGKDEFECEINVSEDENHYTNSIGGRRIALRKIRFEDKKGGGARSGSFFPSGVFDNSNNEPKYFHFNVKKEKNMANDSFMLGSGKDGEFFNVEGLIKITEIRED